MGSGGRRIDHEGIIQHQKPQSRKAKTATRRFLPWVDRKVYVRSVEGSRQQRKVGLRELLSPPKQAHGDGETSVGKKRTPELRHRDRTQHAGNDGYGKDADRKTGRPRYLLRKACRT